MMSEFGESYGAIKKAVLKHFSFLSIYLKSLDPSFFVLSRRKIDKLDIRFKFKILLFETGIKKKKKKKKK